MSLRSGSFRRAATVLAAASVALSLSVPASAAPGAGIWQTLGHTKWVSQGSQLPRHRLYVVLDPNCPYCHELWGLLRTHYSQGLQVRYVIVGFISRTSPGKAAAILEAGDPSAALNRDESQWGQLPDDLGGGIQPQTKMAPGTARALMDNERAIHELGVVGTPALIYRDKAGHAHLLQSVPSDQELARIVSAATTD